MFRSILAILIVLTVASSAFGQAGRSVVPVHDDSIKGGMNYWSYPYREHYGAIFCTRRQESRRLAVAEASLEEKDDDLVELKTKEESSATPNHENSSSRCSQYVL